MAEEQLTFSGISEKEVKECRKIFDEGGVKALKEYFGKKLNEWKEIPLNIGIIGNSGTGKSSFINTIRSLKAKSKGAAKVGVTETTTEPTSYAHPNNEQLKFWDLPGVGTPNFPRETYLEDIGFDKFDFFLIIASERFTENDQWLAKEIDKKGKRFFFVRSKIDIDVQNNKYDDPETSEESVLIDIRNNIKENLEDLYKENNVFLIDNHRRSKYDFDKLERRIIEDFPLLKRDALILSLTTLNEGMVRKKAQTLRKFIWMSCFGSAAAALIPVPFASVTIDITLIFAQTEFYFYQLGLDEESLNRIANITSCDVNLLQGIVNDSARSLLTIEGITAFVRAIPSTAAKIAAEEGARFIPVIGWMAASMLSFSTTYFVLNKILMEIEEKAVRVVQAAVNNSTDLLLNHDSDN